MRRILWKALLAVLLTSCANPSLVSSPPPTAPPTDDRRPTTDDRRPTTDEPTIAAPTAPPTSAPPTAELASPAPTTAQPAPSAPFGAPLDPQGQAAALLPDFRSDLDQAGAWNRYTIDAAIDPGARTIAGRLRLEYTNHDTARLDALYFHLYPNLPDFAGRLDVTALAVDGQALPIVYELRRYLLRVDLRRPLAPGESAAVTLDFTTRAPQNASGKYGAFNKEGGVLALASSYPIAAIVRGGTWDIGWPDGRGDFVNSETALYDVTLTAPADWQLITTGVVADGRLDGGQQTARIVSGPQRDFMISAAQYGVASAEVNGTRVNSYYRPGDAAGGQAALQAAGNALRAFNARYGRYPLAELDVVEVSARSFLGVEYPGMILIQSNLYGQGGGLEITVAHEVGHQWWYSLVGNNVQTAAWLDEALASYSQIVYQEQVHGPEAAERELEGFRQRYRDAVAAGRDAPVDQPTAAFRGNYVAIVYGKAVLFFQALRKQIGDTAFDRFLHDYYANRRYGFVTGADLLASAEGACSCNLDDLYRDWITRATPMELP
ncbi:MAG: M1 family metallopeptidase [Roseiflexaceae bacterium]